MDNSIFKLAYDQQSARALYFSNEEISGGIDRSTLFYYVFLEEGVRAPETIIIAMYWGRATVTK